jgi:hypothetical protein
MFTDCITMNFYLEFRTHWLLHKKIWVKYTLVGMINPAHDSGTRSQTIILQPNDSCVYLKFLFLFLFHNIVFITYGKSSKAFQNIGLVCWGYCCKIGGPVRTNLLQNT